MKFILFRLTLIIILSLLGLSACNLTSSAPSPTPISNLAFTQAAQTVQALLTNPAPTSTVVNEATSTLATPQGATNTSTVAATTTPTVEPTATPSPTPENCTNVMDFVDDITVPDNTVFLPGQAFTKTWRIGNIGTCTWTAAYSLVFVDGDTLNTTSPIPLSVNVSPQTEVDISIVMTAPGVPGTYRSNWVLRTPSGAEFGVGHNGNEPIWVQIIVQEGADELNLGSPDWRDPLDTADNWYLLDTAYTRFTVDQGRLVMEVIQLGGGEEWGLSNRPSIENFFLQATFITSDSCSGADRYGVLVRAPDTDQGYVYGFNCSGRYRLYAWDGENYRPIQEWTNSTALRSGANQTNVLGIWLVGDTIKLYANGQLLAEFTDNQFSSGQFGLFIGSPDNLGFTVYVDEVATWDLGN
jgi:hypothetical protein